MSVFLFVLPFHVFCTIFGTLSMLRELLCDKGTVLPTHPPTQTAHRNLDEETRVVLLWNTSANSKLFDMAFEINEWSILLLSLLLALEEVNRYMSQSEMTDLITPPMYVRRRYLSVDVIRNYHYFGGVYDWSFVLGWFEYPSFKLVIFPRSFDLCDSYVDQIRCSCSVCNC